MQALDEVTKLELSINETLRQELEVAALESGTTAIKFASECIEATLADRRLSRSMLTKGDQCSL